MPGQQTEPQREILGWPDIGYVATAETHECHVEFKVYAMLGTTPPGVYLLKKDCDRPEPTDSFDDAEVYLSGDIKWDGCSDWHFDEEERNMLHFCSQKDAANLGALLGRLYEHARNQLGPECR